jgi:hypothetical protein
VQVKNRTGTWIDVMLKEDEVAVFLGRTAQVASAGLLKASTYRLVRPHASTCLSQSAMASRTMLSMVVTIFCGRWVSCRKALGTRTWNSICARGRMQTWTCPSSLRLPATTCQNGAPLLHVSYLIPGATRTSLSLHDLQPNFSLLLRIQAHQKVMVYAVKRHMRNVCKRRAHTLLCSWQARGWHE